MDKVSSYFQFEELRTDYGTEIRAGVVTFMTMAYIIFVNPTILMGAKVPFESVLVATCISAAIATALMGLLARYPIAAAPGMGMNAFFVSVVISYNLTWPVVMGMVFWAGVLFLALTLLGVWNHVVDAIPATLKYSAACGIGAFIFYIGLQNAGIVTIKIELLALPSPGDFTSPMTLISIAGLVLTAALMVRGVRGALLIGLVGTGALAVLMGQMHFERPQAFDYSGIGGLDILDSINIFRHPEYIAPIVVLLFFDMFDTLGTLIGVSEQAGLMKKGVLPRLRESLVADSAGTIVGAVLGTSTVTSYIESAAGVSEGGRSGFANLVTGLLFLLALGILLILLHWGPGMVVDAPRTLSHITAPALIVVGTLMMTNITKIPWERFDEALPAILVILVMPLSYRISMGLAVGFISWPLLKLIKGEGRQVSWVLYLLAAMIVVGFVCLELFGRV